VPGPLAQPSHQEQVRDFAQALLDRLQPDQFAVQVIQGLLDVRLPVGGSNVNQGRFQGLAIDRLFGHGIMSY